MNSILENLNPVQREAVLHKDGPLLLLSGAGSGKTRVITQRIAYLIQEHGVSPLNIFAVTFTNKAAEEMKNRLENLIGLASKLVWVATFHSSCARILRQDIDRFGYSTSFTIYDGSDQTTLMKEVLKKHPNLPKTVGFRTILSRISKAKERLIDYEDYADMGEDYIDDYVAPIYKEYQTYLKTNNALDFDDLIMLTVKLFAEHPEVLEFYQDKFQYILVDEYQDTNHSQYQLVRMLAAKHKNLCVVGDDDQCAPAGTLISTPNGQMPIEDIRWEDVVIAASGRGTTHQVSVTGIHRKKYEGKLVKITTENGTVLRATPNHILFAQLKADENSHCVYLMYRRDKGYRIGISKGARSNGFKNRPLNVGIGQRCVQENADKVWIIKVCDSRSEAQLWEQYYSVQYGIPTAVFNVRGRAMLMNQEQIDLLYEMVDTERNAKQLMRHLYIFHDYPHYRPKGVSGNILSDRQIVNFKMFSDTRRSQQSPWNAHRVSLNTTDRDLEKRLQSQGYTTRTGRKNTWRVERVRLHYDDALKLANNLSEAMDGLDIVYHAFLTDGKKYSFQPASHIHPGMYVTVEKDGQIIENKVQKVDWEDYRGYVYDLDVEELHNYIANGVVVHNSIYSWRGADINNILDFEKDYEDITTLRLEQNYRSTQSILEAAYQIVKNNRRRKEKRLWTANEEGENIIQYEARNENDEAEYIAGKILEAKEEDANFNDFAVFYRVHAQSRAIEDALRRENIPYTIVGGLKFYERKEIKDILAYLRILANPRDEVALRRIINVPRRGIGNTTMERLANFAAQEQISLFDAVNNVKEIPEIRGKIRASIISFAEMMESFDLLDSPSVIIEQLLDKSKYTEQFKEQTIESQTRLQNIGELVTATRDYEVRASENDEKPTLAGFLENVSLVADIDNLDENIDQVTLMTLHSAKGLEFPVVFIAGMEHGLLPFHRSFKSEEEFEEERRLCYVGITRAEKLVYLTRAESRELFNISMNNPPSEFIDEIPGHLIDDEFSRSRRRRRRTQQKWRHVARNVDAEEETFAYQVGERVHHDTWGRGTILEVHGRGSNAIVKVKFDGGIEKMLMPEYANLQKR